MLDRLNEINMLFDIYAPLLTAKQREVLQLYFSDNYSLAEIAGDYQISRQAVHDLIQRSLSALEKFDRKLGLYALYNEQQDLITEAETLLEQKELDEKTLDRLRRLMAELRSTTEK